MEQAAAAGVWQELKLQSLLANTNEEIDANINSALDRKLPPFQTLMGKSDGAVAIVGNGPSLKENWRELLRFKGDILACNGAFAFLLEKGIKPKFMFCFEAHDMALDFIKPVQGVTYLLASRCPPKAYDLLAGCPIVCWHAAGDHHIRDILEARRIAEPMVTGGTAAVTRAMNFVPSMGYKDIHIWGGDSSHLDGATHARKGPATEKPMRVQVNKREFVTSAWMAVQVEDFKILAPMLLNTLGLGLHVHGDGLLPHVAMSMGCRTDIYPRVKQFAREWKWKARSLWQNL